jgi:hypothetical protein
VSPDLFGSVLLANKAAVVVLKLPDAYRLLDKPIANFVRHPRHACRHRSGQDRAGHDDR